MCHVGPIQTNNKQVIHLSVNYTQGLFQIHYKRNNSGQLQFIKHKKLLLIIN